MIPVQFSTVVIILSGLCVLVTTYDTSQWKSRTCERKLSSVTSQMVYAPAPPNPRGHWTSSQCEHRPGPEFVLRKYHFRRNNFLVKVYYYTDDGCTEPTHVIIAKGAYRSLRGSWRVKGGYEARYRVFQISVIPYTNDMRTHIENLLNLKCPALKRTKVKTYSKYKIYQFSKYNKSEPGYRANRKDFDCSDLFNFTLNELQLMRIEKRPMDQEGTKRWKVLRSLRSRRGHVDTELFLGDLHTNIKHRQSYRPSAYQAPLKVAKTRGCPVCSIVSNSNEWFPPRLDPQPLYDSPLEGEWISTRCETRPYGQFVTRHVRFLPGGRSWQGEYVFHMDPLCAEPSFAVLAKGHYIEGDSSTKVPHATEYVFRINKLKVTLKNPSMVSYFNVYSGKSCGKTGKWELGITQDVTDTNGCEILGLSLPNIEYELLRTTAQDGVEKLYVGQRPSDFVSMAFRYNRPTAFQPALVKCSATAVQLQPNTYSAFTADQKFPVEEILTSGAGSRDSIRTLAAILVLTGVTSLLTF